jgi:hypothetical protein
MKNAFQLTSVGKRRVPLVLVITLATSLSLRTAEADQVQDLIADCNEYIADCNTAISTTYDVAMACGTLRLDIVAQLGLNDDHVLALDTAMEMLGNAADLLEYAISRFNAAKQVLGSSMPLQQKISYAQSIIIDGLNSFIEGSELLLDATEIYMEVYEWWESTIWA